MIRVKSSNDPRAGIQNGFWAIKFLIIIGGMIGSFFMPVGAFGEYDNKSTKEGCKSIHILKMTIDILMSLMNSRLYLYY